MDLRRWGLDTKSKPRGMTDAHRTRAVTSYVGAALLILGSIGLVVGVIAWRIPAPKPVRVTAAVLAELPSSNVFGSGVTLFATVPDHRNPPLPRVFGCTVSKADEAPIEALARPTPELVGSRVVDGAALTGVVDLGHPAGGAQLRCDGTAATASPSLWVLPSQEGPSGKPLAIVVVSLFLIGLGALVHPRTRSI